MIQLKLTQGDSEWKQARAVKETAPEVLTCADPDGVRAIATAGTVTVTVAEARFPVSAAAKAVTVCEPAVAGAE